MTLRLQMLQTARLAQRQLGDSCESVAAFVQTQFAASGAGMDRSGNEDLYYTVFALECAQILDLKIDLSATASYLEQQCAEISILIESNNKELDLIHLTSVCRCVGTLAHMRQRAVTDDTRTLLLTGLELFRSHDGSYNQLQNAETGGAYAAFVVLDAYQSLQRDIPDRDALVTSIQSVRCEDGSYGFQPGALHGTTPTTVAAVLALRECGVEPEASAQSWLRARCCGLGGFTAGPLTPVPDLLSTGCALYALSVYGDYCEDISEICLDFIDTLWSSQGSFYGHWEEEVLDCEYTYYGLLALGALAGGTVQVHP